MSKKTNCAIDRTGSDGTKATVMATVVDIVLKFT